MESLDTVGKLDLASSVPRRPGLGSGRSSYRDGFASGMLEVIPENKKLDVLRPRESGVVECVGDSPLEDGSESGESLVNDSLKESAAVAGNGYSDSYSMPGSFTTFEAPPQMAEPMPAVNDWVLGVKSSRGRSNSGDKSPYDEHWPLPSPFAAAAPPPPETPERKLNGSGDPKRKLSVEHGPSPISGERRRRRSSALSREVGVEMEVLRDITSRETMSSGERRDSAVAFSPVAALTSHKSDEFSDHGEVMMSGGAGIAVVESGSSKDTEDIPAIDIENDMSGDFYRKRSHPGTKSIVYTRDYAVLNRDPDAPNDNGGTGARRVRIQDLPIEDDEITYAPLRDFDRFPPGVRFVQLQKKEREEGEARRLSYAAKVSPRIPATPETEKKEKGSGYPFPTMFRRHIDSAKTVTEKKLRREIAAAERQQIVTMNASEKERRKKEEYYRKNKGLVNPEKCECPGCIFRPVTSGRCPKGYGPGNMYNARAMTPATDMAADGNSVVDAMDGMNVGRRRPRWHQRGSMLRSLSNIGRGSSFTEDFSGPTACDIPNEDVVRRYPSNERTGPSGNLIRPAWQMLYARVSTIMDMNQQRPSTVEMVRTAGGEAFTNIETRAVEDTLSPSEERPNNEGWLDKVKTGLSSGRSNVEPITIEDERTRRNSLAFWQGGSVGNRMRTDGSGRISAARAGSPGPAESRRTSLGRKSPVGRRNSLGRQKAIWRSIIGRFTKSKDAADSDDEANGADLKRNKSLWQKITRSRTGEADKGKGLATEPLVSRGGTSQGCEGLAPGPAKLKKNPPSPKKHKTPKAEGGLVVA